MITPGSATGLHSLRWVNSNGEVIASGWISADMEGDTQGLFCIRIDDLEQRIALVTLPRHLGGRQWFFVCPVMDCRASVLWLPRGAQQFASRHAQLAIHDADGSGPFRQGEDQAASDRRA